MQSQNSGVGDCLLEAGSSAMICLVTEAAKDVALMDCRTETADLLCIGDLISSISQR